MDRAAGGRPTIRPAYRTLIAPEPTLRCRLPAESFAYTEYRYAPRASLQRNLAASVTLTGFSPRRSVLTVRPRASRMRMVTVALPPFGYSGRIVIGWSVPLMFHVTSLPRPHKSHARGVVHTHVSVVSGCVLGNTVAVTQPT